MVKTNSDCPGQYGLSCEFLNLIFILMDHVMKNTELFKADFSVLSSDLNVSRIKNSVQKDSLLKAKMPYVKGDGKFYLWSLREYFRDNFNQLFFPKLREILSQYQSKYYVNY